MLRFFRWMILDMGWLFVPIIGNIFGWLLKLVIGAIVSASVNRSAKRLWNQELDSYQLLKKYKSKCIIDIIMAVSCLLAVIGVFAVWAVFEDNWIAAGIQSKGILINITTIITSLLVLLGFIFAYFYNKSRYQALLLQQTTQEYYMSNYGVCSYENLLSYMGERAVREGYEVIETDEENHPGIQFDLLTMKVKVNYNFGQRHTQLAVLRVEDMDEDEYLEFLGATIGALQTYALPKKKMWVNSFASIICIVKETVYQEDFDAREYMHFKEFSAFMPVIIEASTGKIFYMGGHGDHSNYSDLQYKEVAKHQFRYIKKEIEKLVLGKATQGKKKEKDWAKEEYRRDRIR